MSTHQIQITEISIFPVEPKEGNALQAFVRIVLNDAFVINGLRVVNGKFGQFVAFPKQKGKKDFTICFPIQKALHEEISNTILNEYRLFVSASQNETKEIAV
jgi:DNA-binding cell septation regulator SpoVG